MALRTSFPCIAALLALAAGLLTACDNTASQPTQPQLTYEQKQINAAAESARAHLDQFINALQDPAESQSNFMIRKDYQTQFGSERAAWILVDEYDGTHFIGTIDVASEDMQSLQSGQTVKVKRDEVVDWMYTDDGSIIGGWTLRVAIDLADAGRRQLIMEAFGLTKQDLRRPPHQKPGSTGSAP